MRLRFDYLINANATVNVTIVTERDDSSQLCGRLVMDRDAWDRLWTACLAGEAFKFVNKGEPA
jgi:hypothetical protein